MYVRKSVGPRMEPWWTQAFFQWLPMQNHWQPSTTQKRRNKAKYLTGIKFVKRTRMLNSVKSLRFIKRCSSSSPKPIKSPSNSIRCNCQKICSWSRRPETILETRKNTTFFKMINKFIIFKNFKNFTNHGKKTNRKIDFSHRPFPNIFRHNNHRWKTRFLQTHIEEFS